MGASKRLNILAFTNFTGSAQWRLQGPANYINARTEHEFFVTSSQNWDNNTLEADVVIAQMWRNPKGIDVIHDQGAIAVYEADDIIIGVGGGDRENLMDLSKEHEEMTKETIAKCDLVTVTTEPLAEHYRQFNPHVVVLPNYMDYMWWGKPWKAKPAKQVRIGWMGSISHREDLMFQPIMKRIVDEFDFVKFIYCGHGGKKGIYGEELFKDVPPDRREYYSGVPLEYWPQKSKSLGIDIGIAPLLNDEFNTGKSALKYFEYSSNGVPGVYSDTIVYKDAVKHGVTGFLANNEDDWFRYLSKLILNEEINNRIKQAAYNDILDNYNMEDHYHEWIEAYERASIRTK